MRWLHRQAAPAWGKAHKDVDPSYICALRDRLSPLFDTGAPYEVDVRSFEELPPSPVLLVSNHSGGSTVADAFGFLWAWYRHFGTSRIVHVLAHEVLFATRLTGPFMARCGAVPASPENALEILRGWRRDVLVMPGGADDTWRPWRDRHRVCFAGRKGYARLALRAGAPIVPVANSGPHDTLRVLTDGRRFARWCGLHRWLRIDVFPIHLSLPWGLGIGPLPHLPIPTPLRYRLGEAIHTPYAGRGAPDDALVDALDQSTRDSLQGLLDVLAGVAVDDGPRGLRLLDRVVGL